MSAGDRWSYRSRAAPVATPTQSSYSSRRGAWAAVPRRGGAWPQHSTHALHGAWATEGYGAHCGRRYERLEARPRGRGRRGTPFSSACRRGRTAAHRGYGREFDSTPTPPPSERRTVRLEKGGGGRVAAIPNGERGGVTPTLTPWQNGRPGGRAPTGGRVRWGGGGISGGAATPPASAPCTHTMGGVPTGNHGPRERVVWQGAPRPGGTGTAPNMHQPRRSCTARGARRTSWKKTRRRSSSRAGKAAAAAPPAPVPAPMAAGAAKHTRAVTSRRNATQPNQPPSALGSRPLHPFPTPPTLLPSHHHSHSLSTNENWSTSKPSPVNTSMRSRRSPPTAAGPATTVSRWPGTPSLLVNR